MKFAICAVILALAVVQTFGQSHTVQWGSKQPGDRQLYREIHSKKGSFLQVKSEDVSLDTDVKIHHILATDQYTDDNGGSAKLTEGGVGLYHAKLHLKSKRGHGYNFIIEVWGS